MKTNKNETRVIMGLLAVVFALMAIVAMQSENQFMAKLFGVLALLCFGIRGVNLFKGLR